MKSLSYYFWGIFFYPVIAILVIGESFKDGI